MMLALLFAAAYLLGSVPTAYIYCRLRGKDIRKHASGNVGATNAARLFGKQAFFLIFFLDAAKGFVPVYFLAPALAPRDLPLSAIMLATVLAAVAGHVWSVFLKFRGGKGVATSLGALCAVMPAACGAALLVFAAVFAFSRIVSLSSLAAALAFPPASWIAYRSPLFLGFSLLLSGFIFYTHRANIKRLAGGTENRMGSTKNKP
jgi:glycerol-3-phosphate acyltransferase PlsY